MNATRVLCLIAALPCVLPAAALEVPIALSGSVTDTGGAPLSGVSVTLKLAEKSTTTSTDGSWSLVQSGPPVGVANREIRVGGGGRGLVITDGRLRMDLGGFGLDGRLLSRGKAPAVRLDHASRTRAAVAVDTVVVVHTGRHVLRVAIPVDSLTQGFLGVVKLDTSKPAPPVMGGSGTILDRYGIGKVTVDGREYIVQANGWGSSGDFMTLAYDGTSFRILKQTGTSSNPTPLGYPSAFIGSNSSGATDGSNLPKQVSTLNSVSTSWTWSSAGATGIWNAAYEVWFSNTASKPVSSPDQILKVWLYRPSGRQPFGSRQAANVSLVGLPGSWDIWWDGMNVSYVATTTQNSVSFDLNTLFQDAIQRRYLSESLYLQSIFTGFEIWSGGVGLESKGFTAVVQ